MKIWHKLSVIERNFQSSDRTQTDTDQKHPPDLRLLLSSIMEESYTRRILILGKSGSGKSSLANTILGTKDFNVNESPNSGTKKYQSKTKCVNGRSVQLVDTPGFFDTDPRSPELSPEIIRCITECAPGPHAFLLVLKVEKFTKQEQAVVDIILEIFSEEALKYTTVVFTYGDDLPEGMKIKNWVSKNDALNDLVKKCGGRCHVFDNKYWNKPEEKYRNNKVQVEELLNTIDTTVRENGGGYYTNELLQKVGDDLKREEDYIRQSESLSTPLIGGKAKQNISNTYLIKLAGVSTGIMVGALVGVPVLIVAVVSILKAPIVDDVRVVAATGTAAGTAAGTTIGTAAGAAAGAGLVVGGAVGGWIGYDAAEQAETPGEGAVKAAEAVWNQAEEFVLNLCNKIKNKK